MAGPHVHSDPIALEDRRLQAVRWIREGTKLRIDVARELGVSHTAVSLWWATYLAQGEEALRHRRRPGRPPKVGRWIIDRLPELLERGAMRHGFPTDAWTTRRVAQLIQSEFGVRYSQHHLSRILRALNLRWRASGGWGRSQGDAVAPQWTPSVVGSSAPAKPDPLEATSPVTSGTEPPATPAFEIPEEESPGDSPVDPEDVATLLARAFPIDRAGTPTQGA
jgi:transposase